MGKLRKRMSFSRIDEVLDMPDLIEVQKNSYQRFLDWDLREVLHDRAAYADKLRTATAELRERAGDNEAAFVELLEG